MTWEGYRSAHLSFELVDGSIPELRLRHLTLAYPTACKSYAESPWPHHRPPFPLLKIAGDPCSAMEWRWAIALAKLVFHLYFNNRYGYFREEFNYLSCSDHLQ